MSGIVKVPFWNCLKWIKGIEMQLFILLTPLEPWHRRQGLSVTSPAAFRSRSARLPAEPWPRMTCLSKAGVFGFGWATVKQSSSHPTTALLQLRQVTRARCLDGRYWNKGGDEACNRKEQLKERNSRREKAKGREEVEKRWEEIKQDERRLNKMRRHRREEGINTEIKEKIDWQGWRRR